jgi:hypothetical protein
VRLSAFLLAVAMAGVVGGAWLIGQWAVGCAIIADSVALAAWALLRDIPEKPVRGDQLDLIRNRRAG